MCPKDVDGKANSVDFSQNAHKESLIKVCTVCSHMSYYSRTSTNEVVKAMGNHF